MMNKEEYIISFKDQTGFRIPEGDITTGKVVVNGIEITSVEDWEKVTKSLIDLQQRINDAKDVVKEIKLHYQQHPTMIPSVEIDRLDEILGGKE